MEFTGIALIVMGPLLRPGYILALDMPWSPNLRAPAGVDNLYPYLLVTHWLDRLLPSWLIQKAVLILILTLAGVGAYRLVRNSLSGPERPAWVAYFAGLFYMINPFVYSRLISGQFLLVAGYALLPFFIISLQQLFDHPSWRFGIQTAAWLWVITAVSIHAAYFAVITAAISLVVGWPVWRRHPKRLVKIGLGSLLVFVIASSYWLIPTLRGHSDITQQIDRQDSRHVVAFQSVSDPKLGVIANQAALYGFWGDREGRYVLPKTVMPAWLVLIGLIWLLSVVGFVQSLKRRHWLGLVLALSGVLGLVWAAGVASGQTAGFFNWSIGHLPFFSGFRDSQKFVALVVLAEVYLAAVGALSLAVWWQRSKPILKGAAKILPALLVILPILYTPTMLWGFNRQLRSAEYPASWYQANRLLKQDRGDYRVLVWPWHQYLRLNFSGQVVANPTLAFFDRPVIAGDNLEFGQIYSTSRRPESARIDLILAKRATITNLAEQLSQMNIKYVVLLKEVDWESYQFVDHQGLNQVYNSPELTLYRNPKYASGN